MFNSNSFTLEDAKKIIKRQQKEIWAFEQIISTYKIIQKNQEKLSLHTAIEELKKGSIASINKELIIGWLRELENYRINDSVNKSIETLKKEENNE